MTDNLIMTFIIVGITVPVFIMLTIISKKNAKSLIDNAKVESEKIIAEAKALSNEIQLKASQELVSVENKINSQREAIRSKQSEVDKKEYIISNQLKEVESKSEKLEKLLQENEVKQKEITSLVEESQKKLEMISSYTKKEATEIVLKEAKESIKEDLGKWLKEQEEEANETASKRAIELMVDVMPKYAQDVVSEKSVSLVNIPNDDIKGKIIGREGRNIRAFEAVTGVDLIVDDTPNVITVSCFDPIRREVAKRALEKLIKDGRIQPSAIEEEVAKVKNTMEDEFLRTANEVMFELKINKLPHELKRLVGILKYRTSYGQNALVHSKEVASLAGLMAAECGVSIGLAKRAGLLHDIGKALDFEHEGTHVELGAQVCLKHNEHQYVINGIETHHGNKPPIGIIPILVTAADALSAARPGARRQSLEQYVERIRKLEELAASYSEVKEVFAVKAGREIRVIVQPNKANDDRCEVIAKELKQRIEDELQYPGNVIVNVIRETRHTQIAQ